MGRSLLKVHEQDLASLMGCLPEGTVVLQGKLDPSYIKPKKLLLVIEGPAVPDAPEVLAMVTTEWDADQSHTRVVKIEFEPR